MILIFGVVAVLCTLLAPANYWWLLGVIPLVVWVFMLNWRRGILLEKTYGLMVPELLRSAVRRLPDERAKNIDSRYHSATEFPATYAVDFFKDSGGWVVKRYIACVETRLAYTEQYGKVVQAMMGMLPDNPREAITSGMAAQTTPHQQKINTLARSLVGGGAGEVTRFVVMPPTPNGKPKVSKSEVVKMLRGLTPHQHVEHLKSILDSYDIDITK